MNIQNVVYMVLGCLFNENSKAYAINSNVSTFTKTKHGYRIDMTARGATISGVFTTKKRRFTGTVANNGKVKTYRSYTSVK